MTREEKNIELERMLTEVPDIMSPLRASKCSPFGKNRIYELIKSKELRAFVFQGSYIIAKTDLIETIVDHSDREGRTYKIGHEVKWCWPWPWKKSEEIIPPSFRSSKSDASCISANAKQLGFCRTDTSDVPSEKRKQDSIPCREASLLST